MRIIINGLATEYLDEGRGKTLLLLHGWQDNLHTFDKLAAKLAEKYRVVRLDLPGFGETETPRRAWNLEDYAEFISAFCRKLGIQVFCIIGHSLGGRISIKSLSGSILNTEKLVLIASAGVAKRNPVRSGALLALARIGNAAFSIPPLRNLKGSVRRSFYKAIGSDYEAAGKLRGTFQNIIREDLSDAAKKIAAPTLLIWGHLDRETPLFDGQRLSNLIRGSRIEIVEGAGHFVHRERTGRVADLILHFL
ncbi:MAG: Hydrolase, alpha/beta domain protein [Parcubacteria group bacterium GW2011_GWA2_51_10]|nr:MAG: Hydrolase, alpha/beta domain protein [Parcubacteria group bacterium GW2011_GWA2_51_10]